MYKKTLELLKSFVKWTRGHKLAASLIGSAIFLSVTGFVLYPFFFPPYAQLTEMLNEKKYADVINKAEYLTKYRSNDAVLLTILGNAYLGYGNDHPDVRISFAERAFNIFMKANDLDPTLIQAFKSRAKAGIILKKYSDALTALSRALAIAPNDTNLNSDLAELYFSQSNLNQAQQYFNRAVTLDENNFSARIGLIKIYLARGQNETVINQGIPLLAKIPSGGQKISLESMLGAAYLKMNNFKEAEKYFESVLSVSETAANLTVLADALFRDNSITSVKDAVKSTTRAFDLASKATRLDTTYPYSYVVLYNISKFRNDTKSEEYYKQKALVTIAAYAQMSDAEKKKLTDYLSAIPTTLSPKTKATARIITDLKQIKAMTNTLTIKKK